MREFFTTANRLRLHLLEWGESGPVVLLLHGFLEHAHAWDWVAPRLAEEGFHVFALDWRGHGDSEWVGAGGYYHFADYVADLAFLVRELGGRAALVAHSMGGGAAVLYAGTEPDRVTALVSVEGLGVPDSDFASAPPRFETWIAGLERLQARQRPELTLEQAERRLRERFPRFSDEAVRHMAEHGTRPRGAAREWKFDPLHQTRSPQPYYMGQARAFWRRVRCPVLYVEGAESDLRPPEEELRERLAALRARRVAIAGSGHHPHLERPHELAAIVVEFLREVLWC
jgi:pimeloyl-ACP methyl ester carboxylesterase